jgi:transcriptional regulator with PAS, ATPase and Fis domain
MITVNCAALPATLLEAELFGHEKGAFTGAHEKRQGRVEQAQGGTLFLDEIGEIDATTQVKLLRLLGERTYERLGSSKTQSADVRFLSATNKDLRILVNEGRFREDLFFRIAVVPIHLPPLRNRVGDVPLLVQFFLSKIASKSKQNVKGIASDAMSALEAFHWPGNIRQLENEIQRACVMSGREDTITRSCLSPSVLDATPSGASLSVSPDKPLKDVLARVEREMIEQALARCEGNKSEAARQLGISRSNLIAKSQEYGID